MPERFCVRAHWPKRPAVRSLRLALLLLLAAPGAAWAADATITSQDLPIGVVRSPARGGCAAALRPGRVPLAGLRPRPLPDPLAGGPLERLAARGPGRRGPAGSCEPRGARAAGLAPRQPVLGRPVRPDRVPARRGRAPPPRLVRLEPGLARRGPACLDGRVAADRAALGVARERGDHARAAALREGRLARDRPPHGRHERVQPLRLGGDRPRDRAVPRAREPLERHRLQLSRRPLRPGLRGARRRDRQERDRRAGPGVQHRVGRRCLDRQLQHRQRHLGGAEGARLAARVAARRCARRPARHRRLGVRRQSEVQGGEDGRAAGDLGPPRYRLHVVPGDAALLAAPLDRRGRGGDRAAEALRPRGEGVARRADHLLRAALAAGRLDRDGARPRRDRRRPRHGPRRRDRLDVELRRPPWRQLHLDDGGRGRRRGRRKGRSAARPSRRPRRPRRRPSSPR